MKINFKIPESEKQFLKIFFLHKLSQIFLLLFQTTFRKMFLFTL